MNFRFVMMSRISFVTAIFLTVFFLTLTAFSAEFFPIKVVGGRHRLVLMSDGSVIGWGAIDKGSLGPKAAIPQESNHATQIVSIKLPRKAIDVAAMSDSSLAVLDDGSVVGWGQLNNSETPVKLQNLSDIGKIVAAGEVALALKRDGTVYGFGRGGKFAYEKIPGLQNIEEISVGLYHGMALDADGNVWTWANNDYGIDYGVLGRTANPYAVEKVQGLNDVVSVAAQQGVSTVVKSDGTVWVWGCNYMSQFGNGKRSETPNRGDQAAVVTVPQQVAGIRGAASVANTGNALHTIILMKDGTLRSWGNSDFGQVGSGISGGHVKTPAIPKIAVVKAVFTIVTNSYAIKADGTLWMWGVKSAYGFPYNKNEIFPRLLQLK